eukprot:4958-Amphidinium_carterae.1
MAAGKASESLILDGEVFARGVRRRLMLFGKLVERAGVQAMWNPTGLWLCSPDKHGNLRTAIRAHMRESTPHLSLEVVSAV